jgi:hypothetical protein
MTQPSDIQLAAEVFRGERSQTEVFARYGVEMSIAVARRVDRLNDLQAASDRAAERLDCFMRTGRYPDSPTLDFRGSSRRSTPGTNRTGPAAR